jgi:hypothetical protein
LKNLLALVTLCSSPGGSGGLRADPPYPESPVIKSLVFDLESLKRAAPGSDLWPMTWADDGHLYTAWGDGGGFGGTNDEGRVALGVGRVEGGAESWRGFNILGGKLPEAPGKPMPGKSNGILCVDGVLYLHLIEEDRWWRSKIGWSRDHGRTWTFNEGAFDPGRWDYSEPDGAFSDLTFLTFGRDSSAPRDGFVYLYSQDARRGKEGEIRDLTDGVALFRVPRQAIADRARHEYFAGLDASGKPRWTRRLEERKPVFANPGGVGWGVRVCYSAPLRRYLLTTFHRWDGSFGIYDAPAPWGPWTTAAYYQRWIDETPKFGFTFPEKWMDADGKTLYMVFSGTKVYDSFNVVRARISLKP